VATALRISLQLSLAEPVDREQMTGAEIISVRRMDKVLTQVSLVNRQTFAVAVAEAVVSEPPELKDRIVFLN
jgi:hypothetical protein